MVKLSELEVGKKLMYIYKNVTRKNVAKYASVSGDWNNIHIDDNYAASMGLRGIIVHGCYSLAMVGQCLTEVAGEQGQVLKIYGEMRGMVRPGDDYLITLEVKTINKETGIVDFEYVEQSKTPIKIEKNGKVVKKFEAEERGWIETKDIEQALIKTEEIDEGILYFRLRNAIPGTATIRFVNNM